MDDLLEQASKPVPPSNLAPTYLVSEDFEGIGTASKWADSGTVFWDYTDIPLVASQSFLSPTTGSSAYTITEQSNAWAYCVLCTTNVSNGYVLRFQNGGTNVAGVYSLGASVWRVYNGSLYATSAGSVIATNTIYHIWLHYIKGTGSDGKSYLYWSTNSSTRAASPQLSKENGNAVDGATSIRIGSSTSSALGLIQDKIRADDEEIGSDPQ